jgi:hypothetical protein
LEEPIVPEVAAMRTRFGLCAVVLALAAAVSSLVLVFSPGIYGWQSLNRPDQETGLPEAVLASIKHRLREIDAPESTGEQKLVCVTQQPFFVRPWDAMLCRGPWPTDPPTGPHARHWIHVYVTRNGYDTMKTGKGTYPRGTLILKEKLGAADATKAELFTGMLKREQGYSAESGDWQFFVLNSDATTVSTGNTRSCIHCHAPFSDTDFVSRSYLTTTAVAGQ